MAVLCRLSYSSGDRAMIRVMRRMRPAIVLLLLLAGACGGDGAPPEAATPATSPSGVTFPAGTLIITTDEGEVRVNVGIAETEEARQQGLMNVRRLAADRGMVFIHEEPTDGGFWMKNTLIPLSLAVWDEQGRIGAILDMEPCRKDPCPVYDPGVTWIGALEVNQGFFADHGVEVGDTVRLER